MRSENKLTVSDWAHKGWTYGVVMSPALIKPVWPSLVPGLAHFGHNAVAFKQAAQT